MTHKFEEGAREIASVWGDIYEMVPHQEECLRKDILAALCAAHDEGVDDCIARLAKKGPLPPFSELYDILSALKSAKADS